MKQTRVGLVEIGDSFGGQYYFPYSIGLLLAYAGKKLANPQDYAFAAPVYKRGDFDASIEYLSDSDIVFFSSYLWNFKASLEIARRLKEKHEKTITVFGGPQVPESQHRMSEFLRAFPFIDVASYGAGEIPFLRLLERAPDRDWANVTSVGYRKNNGEVVRNPVSECEKDINEIPSPYLEGVFDVLMSMNPGQKWSGLLETNRGCPFTCAYCYWGKKSDRTVVAFQIERVYRELDWFSRHKIEFIFCCDANFGILKRDMDIAVKVAENKKAFGFPQAFSVQNTKNTKERIFGLQKILNDSGLQKGVNLALQSMNKQTLKYIERSNINNKTYTDLQRLFAKSNIQTFTDLIIGLPGESYDSFTEGVSEIIHNGQHNRIQFINLTILENTLMARPEFQGKHDMRIVEAAFVPHHASPAAADAVVETQSLVIGTRTMPRKDWIRTRVFGWMASLLHFNKLLQVPFILLHEMGAIPYKILIENMIGKADRNSILPAITRAFEDKAREIIAGGSEYSYSERWLHITWYPDEMAIIGLCTEGKLHEFYDEALNRLLALSARIEGIPPMLVTQAVQLNHLLIRQPFLNDEATMRCDYNIWDVYQAAFKGERLALQEGNHTYIIDRRSRQWSSWEDWCREVIWYGNKKGDYIYSVKKVSQNCVGA